MTAPTIRRLARSFLLGVIATVVGLAVKFEYCIGGPGYGFPAAVIHPSHQEWWLVSLSSPPSVEGLAFDPLSLCMNVVMLSLIVFGISAAIQRRRVDQSVVRLK